MSDPMPLVDAVKFLGIVFHGEHNIPGPITAFGYGWKLHCRRTLETYDGDLLTRLVVLGHDLCVRVEVGPSNPQGVSVVVHQRQRTAARQSERHPTLEDAAARCRQSAGWMLVDVS